MGQSVNPVGFRLGQTRAWPVIPSFVYSRLEDSYLSLFYLFFFFDRFLNSLFHKIRVCGKKKKRSKFSLFRSLYYSHSKVFFSSNIVFFNIFFFRPRLVSRIRSFFKLSYNAFARSNLLALTTRTGFFIQKVLSHKKRKRRGGSSWTKAQLNAPFTLDKRYFKQTLFSRVLYQPSKKRAQAVLFFKFFFNVLFNSFFSFLSNQINIFFKRFYANFKVKIKLYAIKFYWCYPTLLNRFFERRLKRRYSLSMIFKPITRIFYAGKRIFIRSRIGKRIRQRIFSPVGKRSRIRFRRILEFRKRERQKGKPLVAFLPLGGLSLSASGRFTRQQMAQKFFRTFGRVPFGSFSATIDFSFKPVRLKNSTVGLKTSVLGIYPNESLKAKCPSIFFSPSYVSLFFTK